MGRECLTAPSAACPGCALCEAGRLSADEARWRWLASEGYSAADIAVITAASDKAKRQSAVTKKKPEKRR